MTNISPVTVRKFGAVMKNDRPIAIELTKAEGLLNRIKVESTADNRVLYGYGNKSGLDMEYFKGKLNDICTQIKDGAKLFKEIMEWGLKNTK